MSNPESSIDDISSAVVDNPYSILNVDPNTTIDEIKASYKLLSRAFHPDKQPTGDRRESAQQYFIKFKASYDILIDPALRLAYDVHGMDGVLFLKNKGEIYKRVSALLDKIEDERTHSNSSERVKHQRYAKELLSGALQFEEIQIRQSEKPSVNGQIDIKCNSTHSAFLGEGYEYVDKTHPVEVERSSISMSITKAKKEGKTSLTFGGGGVISGGKGSTNAQLSLAHAPVEGTDVNVDLDIGATSEESKITFGTSRVMSNSTYMTSSIACSSGSTFLSLTSYRYLMQNKIRGTWMMGLALPYFRMQYCLLSFTADYPDKPKITAKLNLGLNETPLQVSAEKIIDEKSTHIGHLSWGWGWTGQYIKATTSRYVSKYCKVTVGLHHISTKGLTWLFALERGSVTFSVPIFITSAVSPGYQMKSAYMALFFGLIDASLVDIVQMGVNELIDGKTSKLSETIALRREEVLLERDKIKRDAQQQIRLMEKPAEAKRRSEEAVDGLIILRANYAVSGGDTIEVTNALMFWVVRSSLHLPSMTKSSMLGFYDVRHETLVDMNSGYLNACWKVVEKVWYGDNVDKKINSSVATSEIPTLTIRYRYHGEVYEMVYLDEDPVSLPTNQAMKLGGSCIGD
mmetsp:Transcript_3791/g.5670  ORF Transcript_3791/g.5670 Transcript_3791/m.5670 type:complete len:629 (-) Transcript_3791:23-1909(-)